MTTAHRPTFDPARGKEAPKGPAYHQRLLPAHMQLKFRQAGQGGDADREVRDLRAELLAAEQAHFAKRHGGALPDPAAASTGGADERLDDAAKAPKRLLGDGGADEDPEAKRRRILAETREMDADSESEDESGSESGAKSKGKQRDDGNDGSDGSDDSEDDDDDDDDDSDSDSDSDSEDETAELQRELEKIRRERAEKRQREEEARAAAEAEAREHDIARGNPLLNPATTAADFTLKRRWDDDVVFKNQARGTDDKGKQKEFINDLLRSDFHKRFMSKYVR